MIILLFIIKLTNLSWLANPYLLAQGHLKVYKLQFKNQNGWFKELSKIQLLLLAGKVTITLRSSNIF